MMSFVSFALLATCARAVLHHLAVGTTDGQALYSLQLDDVARVVNMIQARDAEGASPSLALDRSKKHLFSSRPADGTLTRHLIADTYELINEGTMEIPASCNTTEFTSLHLSSSTTNLGIWGTASTGACSVVFGLSSDGFKTLRSREIVGDVQSIAWSPTGHNLHALDSHASASSTTSITNFRITEDPSLEEVVGIDELANVTMASQIITHPITSLLYLTTKDTNELIILPLQDDALANVSVAATRHKLLPSSIDSTQFRTSSLAITASKKVLWVISQSQSQAVVTAFNLNVTTGGVIDVAARASWSGAGDGYLTAAPFSDNDVIAITNSPRGYVTILGLDQGLLSGTHIASANPAHDYLQHIAVSNARKEVLSAAAIRIKSFGRAPLDDFVALGESVWID